MNAQIARKTLDSHSWITETNLIGAALTPRRAASRPNRSLDSLGVKSGTPEAVDAAIDLLTNRLIPVLQKHLDQLVGRSFSKEESVLLSKALNRLARRLSCGFACPHCDVVARSIRFASQTRGPWAWRFEHSEAVRHGGSATLGRLVLVPRDAPRQRLDAQEKID